MKAWELEENIEYVAYNRFNQKDRYKLLDGILHIYNYYACSWFECDESFNDIKNMKFDNYL